MGEQTDGRHQDPGLRFADRGERFGRRSFLRKAGIGALAVGTGGILAGCQFDDGAYQGRGVGGSSTSGQSPTSGATDSGQGSSGSQSGMSS
jgi:hypothetical protein